MKLKTNQGDEFQVSEADIPKLEGFRFTTHKAGKKNYIRCYRSKEWKPYFYLHRLLTGAMRGQIVDHINGDGTDNRRENLRVGTQSQNCANMKDARGYHWSTSNNGYVVQITVRRKVHCIGTFKTEAEASAAYAEAHRRLHGAFSSRSPESSG